MVEEQEEQLDIIMLKISGKEWILKRFLKEESLGVGEPLVVGSIPRGSNMKRTTVYVSSVSWLS